MRGKDLISFFGFQNVNISNIHVHHRINQAFGFVFSNDLLNKKVELNGQRKQRLN